VGALKREKIDGVLVAVSFFFSFKRMNPHMGQFYLTGPSFRLAVGSESRRAHNRPD